MAFTAITRVIKSTKKMYGGKQTIEDLGNG